MTNIIEKIIKYIFDKYEIVETEIRYCETREIVNKKNKKRLEEETGNSLRLGMTVMRPFIRCIKIKHNN